MPFQALPDELPRASDLIIYHEIGAYNNENANITPAGVIPFGQVVFRAKSLDPAAPWAAVTVASLVATNEFGVVYGDHYGFKANFTPKAIKAGFFNGLVVKRGPAFLKEFYLKKAQHTFNATQLSTLKELLAGQGLVVLETVE